MTGSPRLTHRPEHHIPRSLRPFATSNSLSSPALPLLITASPSPLRNLRHPSSLFLNSSSTDRMDANGVTNYRHRRSLSSNRFLGLFSQSESPTTFGGSDADITGAELNEAEVFWTGDSVESSRRSTFPTDSGYGSHQRYGNRQPEEFGILTALPDSDRNRIPQNSRSSVTSSRAISAIPKPPQSHQDKEKECSQSLPCRKIQNSVPMNIPKAIMERRRCTFDLINDCHDDDSDDDEMLPPHEIVALQVKTTTSVLEGVGRTLKGRDLRQVRNAVWRQTGFLD